MQTLQFEVRGGRPPGQAERQLRRPRVAGGVLLGAVLVLLVEHFVAQPRLRIEPATLDLGRATVGSVTAQQSVAISNSGSSTLAISRVVLAGDNVQDFEYSSQCDRISLAAGKSCFVKVQLRPSSVGPRVAELVVLNAANERKESIPLIGAGTEEQYAQLEASPAELDFGAYPAPPQPVMLTSTGSLPVTVASVSVEPAGAFDAGSDCLGRQLARSDTCTVQVTFNASDPGTQAASLVIASDARSKSMAVPLRGFVPRRDVGPPAARGELAVNPPRLLFDFGQSTKAGPGLLELTNVGDGPLKLGLITVVERGDVFRVINDRCSQRSLAPQEPCPVSVALGPIGVGTVHGVLSIPSDQPRGEARVRLSATRSEVLYPAVSFSQDPVDFGSRALGEPQGIARRLRLRPDQKVTITNSGSAELQIEAVKIEGDRDFSIMRTDCERARLAPAARCTVELAFLPAASGGRRANLLLADNARGSPHGVALLGVGSTPAVGLLVAESSEVTFQPVPMPLHQPASAMPRQSTTVTLANRGPGSVTILAIDPPAAPFELEKGNCDGATLRPHGTCVLTVIFQPVQRGSISSGIGIANTGSGGKLVISLNGNAYLEKRREPTKKPSVTDTSSSTTPEPTTPSIVGRWTSSIGVAYDIRQDGNRFNWYAEQLREQAYGQVNGREITATWSGILGRDTKGGRITAMDADGRATRIEWQNGVIFFR